MKKLSVLLTCFMLITAFSCGSDDDASDDLVLPGASTCNEAIVHSAMASYDMYNATPEEFPARCASLKASIQVQMQICGDEEGDLQDMLDDLGDCTTMPQ